MSSASSTFTSGGSPTAAQVNGWSQGILDVKSITAAQTGLGAGPTDVTGMSSTVTVVAGRRLKVAAYAEIASNTADDAWKLIIANGSGTQLAEAVVVTRLANVGVMATALYIATPSAGSVTYKLRVARIVGTGTGQIGGFAGDSPAYFIVEDAGAV